jgi:hypothetical protein
VDSERIRQVPLWKSMYLLFTFPGTMVTVGLDGLCWAAGEAIGRQAREDCWRNCERTCRKSHLRSLQGRARSTCEVLPPPKATPPPVPPAPNANSDPCWSCAQVGGECCPPYKSDPNTGQVTLCACGNPSLGCERYGCGS